MGRGIGRSHGRRNGLALLAWLLIGAGLRFWALDTKTPWSDEWATLVFSLGHSFQSIPLDQLLSLDEFLAIARLDHVSVGHGLGNVWRYLMAESTHPPLYFWLTHLWLRFWQAPGELVGLGVARSLSALLGVVGIPAAYGLGYWMMAGGRNAQRHRVGVLAAALMALSPFGVYLAQEARHYTLALLGVMTSLGCFFVAWRALRDSGNRLSWPVTLLWIAVNGLGLATHYFVGLLLAAEGLALAGLIAFGCWFQVPKLAGLRGGLIAKLAAVAGGGLLAALPWVPFWLKIPGDRLTEWISQDSSLLERWVMPLLRVVAWLLSMVMLMPVEQVPVGVAVLSGVVLLAALLWLWPQLVSSLRQQVNKQNSAVEALLAVQGAGLLLVLVAIYLGQKDLSLAARYFFVFLPGTVLLGAIALVGLNSRRATVLLLALGFAGSLAVTTGYAFQKPDRPDLLVQAIQVDSRINPRLQSDEPIMSPPVISTFYKTHEQLSEMLAVAWEFQHQGEHEVAFLLAIRKAEIWQNTVTFLEALASHGRPFILWESNLTMAVDFSQFGCTFDHYPFGRVPGYRFRGHLCRSDSAD